MLMAKVKLTRRGENVLLALLALVMVLLLVGAAEYGFSRQDHWRCQHGVQEAC